MLANNLMVLIETDTVELYSFGTTSGYTKGLYRKLSEVIANLSDGKDVPVGNIPAPNYKGWICWIIWIVVAVIVSIIWVGITTHNN